MMHKVLLAKPTPIPDDCSDPRWKWFKGCLGALDGTFIDVRVPEHQKGRYRTHKGDIAVNVLGVCNPNMQFIFVLSGWEGSAATVEFCVMRLIDLTDCVPTGNYYLCDNGYANADGFLTPYRDPFKLELPDPRESGGDMYGECLSSIESNAFWYNGHGLHLHRPCETLEDEGSSQQKRHGQNKNRTGPRRTWTMLRRGIINGLKALVTTGWKCDNGFRNGYLAQLEAHMKRVFPQCHIKAEPHINSKLHVWKKIILHSMLDDGQERTRVGRQSQHGDNRGHNSWDDLLRDRAMGECGWDPTRAGNERTGRDGVEFKKATLQRLTRPATKRTPNRRKRKTIEACPEIPQLVSMVSNFCETANTRIGSFARALESEFGDPSKRGVVMEAVHEIQGLEENDVLIVTTKLVHDPQNIEIFSACHRSQRRRWPVYYSMDVLDILILVHVNYLHVYTYIF
ncbi:UNVERIFIED_CONTAM: hypothetical protein Sradi_6887400 [Sesamum radiatum]|uniref:DDE Tnp4 domain-containing protein n=1 Tax=Sesamum radiatum TaxID=300843 RepID=A0AAW2JJL1_SESRA